MTIDEAIFEISNHGKFTDRDYSLISLWLTLLPQEDLDKFYNELVIDKFKINPVRNGALSMPMIHDYVERWLQKQAKKEGEAMFNAYLAGERIPHFSDEELKEIEFLGVGEGFKAQIAARIYKKLERGML